jgi:hypothetical protein
MNSEAEMFTLANLAPRSGEAISHVRRYPPTNWLAVFWYSAAGLFGILFWAAVIWLCL